MYQQIVPSVILIYKNYKEAIDYTVNKKSTNMSSWSFCGLEA